METAETICRERRLLLTENRCVVLEALLRSDRPMRAYELLQILERRQSRCLSLPTVYRALEFLLAQGLVLRIETMNAFLPSTPSERETPFVF